MFFEHEWFICLNKHSKFNQSSKFKKNKFFWLHNVILESEKKKKMEYSTKKKKVTDSAF